MADMYLMCGICGSGKSTFAKKFAEDNNFRYLNIDDCYAILNGDERIHTNKFEVWQLFYKMIHIAETLNQTVVIDTNAPLVRDRQEFLDWFPGFEKHILIYIDTDYELAWENNNNRPSKRIVPKDDFDRVVKMFQEPTKDEPGARSEWDIIYKIKNKNNNNFEHSIIKNMGD